MKKSFFRQQNVSEILEGRKVLEINQGLGLVEIINSCTSSFVLHLNRTVLPSDYNDSRTFLKFGNEAMAGNEIQTAPRQAIAEALHYANPPFGSFAVKSRVDNVTVTRTLLDTCIQGMKLYAYSVNNAPIKVDGLYKLSNIADSGAQFIVSVPSEEMKGDRHTVRFSSVPLYDNYQKKRLWTDIGAVCDCDFSRWWVTSRYTKEKLFCQHAVAAYFAVAADAFKRGYDTPSQSVPFPMFSEEAIEFWNKMRKQVIKTQSGRRLPLNSAERSLLLGEYIYKHGVKEALYHGGKKAAEFDW